MDSSLQSSASKLARSTSGSDLPLHVLRGSHMKTNRWILGVAALVATLLTGCGGGDGYGGSTPPTGDTGSAVIGAAGGTVATQSGAAKAVFPANAVTANTTVTITASSQAPANSRLIEGTAHDITSSGPLAQPVSVTLRYDPTKLPSGALQSRLVLYKVVGGAWVAVPNSSVDTAAYTVSAPLSSFSLYGVLADNQFAGNYTGSYAGGSSGTWNATVKVDGSLSATATGPFAGTGSVTFGGASTIPLTGSGTSQGFAITFAGNFSLVGSGPGVSAAGNWSSSSGLTGTWVGNKID